MTAWGAYLELFARFSVVGILWGATNPLLKQATEKKRTQGENGFLKDLWRSVANLQFLFLFGLNQLGSVAHLWLLSSYDVSLVVPMSNAMTCFYTALSARIIRETKRFTYKSVFGLSLIASGMMISVQES
eukprot:gb/GECG01016722.1/.p1 GENE.gb/GECG01016722.1/~~gb/GECG01016722.1/.p1  ORF type:complete len:130 (+),score=10.15 gb/GECG01016722.1/:1-390(+)